MKLNTPPSAGRWPAGRQGDRDRLLFWHTASDVRAWRDGKGGTQLSVSGSITSSDWLAVRSIASGASSDRLLVSARGSWACDWLFGASGGWLWDCVCSVSYWE